MTAHPSRRPTTPRAERRPKASQTAAKAATETAPAESTAKDSLVDVMVKPAPFDMANIHLGSMLFDQDWYRAEYPDVGAAGLDPIRHYFDNGAAEGRNPNRFFVTRWYLGAYADVAASRMNPFLHYLLYGAKEGRKPSG